MHLNGDIICYVNPQLIIDNNKKAAWWVKWMLCWQPEQHTIEYFHKSGG